MLLVEVASLVTDDAHRPRDAWHLADPFVRVDVAFVGAAVGIVEGAPVAGLGRVGGRR
jgi:hypothetical protein